jgi:hypothetical protein
VSVKGKGKEVVGKGKEVVRTGREVVEKGKGKEKEREKPVKGKQVKKTIKSVVFIDDDDSSSDKKQPSAIRPTPKPAYRGATSTQASALESQRGAQKATVSTPADKHAVEPLAGHATSEPIPVLPAAGSPHGGHRTKHRAYGADHSRSCSFCQWCNPAHSCRSHYSSL